VKIKILFGATALALVAATVTAMPAVQASAATVPNDGGVSSTPTPSWQTNNTVWALGYSSGVVYVGGQFTSVRPPGNPLGTGEVARTFLAAFNSTTGALVTSFNPTITGGSGAEVTALAASPDGSTLYVGGIFDHINGVYRDNLAAFNIATGALTSWAPAAFGKVNTIATSPDGSEIYIGGGFNQLAGKTVTDAGAVDTAGVAQAWAPKLNNAVTSIAVSPDDSHVVVGGYFTSFNGVSQNSIGSTDATSGTTSYPIPAILPANSSCVSNVKDVIMGPATPANPAGVAYIAGEGTGGGCFDGDYAADVSTGSLIWQNDCLGATQSLALINGWLYKGSHAHDCAFAPGGFPQVSTSSGGWVTRHLLDQSLTDGSLGHFTPDTSSAGGGLGPRVMATDGSQLFLGGDFTAVNGAGQQGFAIFPSGTDPQYPTRPSVAPTATSTSAGVDSVSFPAVSSRDVGTLTYALYRDGTKIASLTATSWPWALPMLRYQDTGLTPGTSHTYTYTASDGPHTTAKSPASASVTVSATSPSLTYQQTVLADNPSFLWPLNETSGTTASDASPNGFNGIYKPGTTQGVPGPITGQLATGFDGQAGLVTSANSVNNPQQFSMELWFKTTTNTGGKLVGFGNTQTGWSSNYDRHIYMMNDGQLVFGVWTGQTQTIETPRVYNDGQWHHVVATLSPTAGMAMYVDSQLVGTNSTTSAQAYTGYWRVGGDNLNGWNLDPWGSNSQGTTQPNSYYFNGSMADVTVYPGALSAAQVGAHYAAALQQNQ
jgi:Concanavalin A-like lectin/glucanases superfamily